MTASGEWSDKILVLDTETTGFTGGLCTPHTAPFFRRSFLDYFRGFRYDSLDWTKYGDLVVDIGVCEASLSTGEVREVYSSVVGYDTGNWPEEMTHSWIFESTDMTVDMVERAPRFSKVKRDISSLVKGRWVTTYNVHFDLDLFLYRFPWCLKDTFFECRDIMSSARDVCRRLYGMKKYRLDNVYRTMFPDTDPAGIGGVQKHRALSDAKVASYVMVKMYQDGQYDPLDLSGRHSK